MTAADSSKNIKRSFSPLPSDTSPRKLKRAPSSVMSQRTAIQYEKPKLVDMASGSQDPRKIFGNCLEDKKELDACNAEHLELLRKEEADAWDREARTNASDTERLAASIIRAIREYERNVVFGSLATEAIPGKHTRDMGGQYLTNKSRIDNDSQLHKIAVSVPKGALLHIHFNSELHPERLLVRARSMKSLYIRSNRPLLTKEDLDLTEMVFNVLDSTQIEPNVNIFSENYAGQGENFKKPEWFPKLWMPWQQFQLDFTTHFPDPKYVQKAGDPVATCSEPGQEPLYPAEVWLKSKMVLSEEEAYGFTQTVNG